MEAAHKPVQSNRNKHAGRMQRRALKRFADGGLVAVSLLCALVSRAPADGAQAPDGPGLFFTDEEEALHPAPTVHTDAHIRVTGVILRAQVTQEFFNPAQEWVEAIYVFPLPETSAVDSLHMIVGTRIIEGQIQKRVEARRTYERAKTSGKKASLLAQNRPNVFRIDVANVGPGESVQIVIQFQDTLRYDSGEFRLRLPTTVMPRYEPTAQNISGGNASTADEPGFDDVLLASCAADDDVTGTLSVSVDLEPGFPLKWLYSPSHSLQTTSVDGSFLVSLDGDSITANRDFVLVWAPQVGQEPSAAVFREDGNDDAFVLLMIMPPDAATDDNTPLRREVVFVIDTSGSMHGPSLEQATLALSLALDNLSELDSFNVIQFNSVTASLFPESVPVTAATLVQARLYIDSLVANGGTVMRPAVEAALQESGNNADVRQVIFVTDGAIGNENELFTLIASDLGRSRLFTVGIGAAPNSHFMRKAAQFGRGTFTYIGSPSEISERMDSLFEKLEEPVIADVAVDWPEEDTEAWPPRVPDLYAGEPLVVAARLAQGRGSVLIQGKRGSETWQQVVSLDGKPQRGTTAGVTGIGKLWARRQIDALMDGIIEGMDRETVRRAVTDLALRHHLLTKFTSLVAVDVSPSAPLGIDPLSRRVPAAPPSVRSGVLPQTATAMPLHLALGFLLTLGAAGLWRERASTCP